MRSFRTKLSLAGHFFACMFSAAVFYRLFGGGLWFIAAAAFSTVVAGFRVYYLWEVDRGYEAGFALLGWIAASVSVMLLTGFHWVAPFSLPELPVEAALWIGGMIYGLRLAIFGLTWALGILFGMIAPRLSLVREGTKGIY